MTLDLAKNNDTFKVQRIESGRQMLARINALGILPNAQLTVIQNTSCGPILIKINDSTVSLGRGIASKIIGTKIN